MFHKVVVFAFTLVAVICCQCQQQAPSAVSGSSVCLCVDAPDRMELGVYADLIAALRDAAKDKRTDPEVDVDSVAVRDPAASGCAYILRPSVPEYSEGQSHLERDPFRVFGGSDVEFWLFGQGNEKAIMHSEAYDTWVGRRTQENKLMPRVAKQVVTAIGKAQRQSPKSSPSVPSYGKCQQRVNPVPKSSARLCVVPTSSIRFRDYKNFVDSLREAGKPEHTATGVNVDPIFVLVDPSVGCDFVLRLWITQHDATSLFEFRLFPAGSDKVNMYYSGTIQDWGDWKSSESKQLMATVAQETLKAIENDPQRSSK